MVPGGEEFQGTLRGVHMMGIILRTAIVKMYMSRRDRSLRLNVYILASRGHGIQLPCLSIITHMRQNCALSGKIPPIRTRISSRQSQN